MPRTRRTATAGYVYHVLNRGVGRMRLFTKPRDHEAFLEILDETLAKISLRTCGFCLMPSAWAECSTTTLAKPPESNRPAVGSHRHPHQTLPLRATGVPARIEARPRGWERANRTVSPPRSAEI